jgi:hypothetical protein
MVTNGPGRDQALRRHDHRPFGRREAPQEDEERDGQRSAGRST